MNLEEILHQHKRPKVWPWVLLAGLILFVAFAGLMFWYARSLGPGELLRSEFIRTKIQEKVAPNDKELFELLLYFLGFSGERTYLVLFEDNMALRPGGGFLDSYALVRVDRGTITVERVEGADLLDARTPEDWQPKAPRAIVQQGSADRWYFRDSNWSPDFGESAKRALDFYAAEGGKDAKKVDVVLGVTPTVFERWLALLGPVTVGAVTVSDVDVANTLAYDARIGYAERGLPKEQRTRLLEDFLDQLIAQSRTVVIERYAEFLEAVIALAEEKQLLAYATQPEVQERLAARGWGGTLAPVEDRDYLLWVDAYLGNKRTDRAVERNLHYTVAPQPGGRHLAVAVMYYAHTGAEDWQTDVYRTFARVFAPAGSDLLSVIISGKSPQMQSMELVERGVEGDKAWFGTSVQIAPGEQKTVQFIYLLPASVSEQIAQGEYGLTIDKQPGVLPYPLTTDLQFGRDIRTASPAELPEFWGDPVYSARTSLRATMRVQVAL